MSKESLLSSFSHLVLGCVGLIDAPTIQSSRMVLTHWTLRRTPPYSLAPIRTLQSSACEWCESAGSIRGSSPPPAAGMAQRMLQLLGNAARGWPIPLGTGLISYLMCCTTYTVTVVCTYIPLPISRTWVLLCVCQLWSRDYRIVSLARVSPVPCLACPRDLGGSI